MFKNYLKVATRYLMRNKGYTFINIVGLAIGITCCVLIMLFVRSEWSYDKFHEKSDRIFRLSQHEVYEGEKFENTSTPLSAAAVIQSTFPEVESTCRIYAFKPIIKIDQRSFTDDVRMVDSTFYRLFDFKLTQGNRANPFPNANSIVLTRETAKKYFGSENAMGKNLEFQFGNDKVLFTVSGIAEKAPEESSIKYNLLLPFANAKHIFRPGAFRSWFNVSVETYVELKKGFSYKALENKFPAMVKKYLGEDYKEGGFIFRLQPMTDIHLNNALPVGIEPISNPKYSYILATTGILILLVACINFIILSVGRSTSRALEVGVRKAMGADRQQLIRQFWGEALLLTIISVVLGLALSWSLLSPFNQIVQRSLTLRFDPVFILFCVAMIGLIALIAGMYPAIILSGFKPIEVLKGKIKMKGNAGWLRQGLVVGQFAASIALIICTIGVGKQMSYLKNKDLGYSKEQLVVVSTNKGIKVGTELANLYRNELLKNPQVASVAVSVYSFAQTPWINMGFTNEKKVYKSFQYNSVDPYFINTMGLQMAAGRAFSPDNPADITSGAIVNESFVKDFGLTEPIGKKLPGPFDQQIVGVVKDFNYMSLHNKILPLIFTIKPDSVFSRTENVSFNDPPQPRISVRLKPGNLAANVDILSKAWKAVAPGQEFEYSFLDESIAKLYQTEQRTSTVVKIASGLAIFIACMGLFGLATLTVTRRTKEIGIRKVLGANVPGIAAMLTKDFAKLIVIAAVIAFPLAWWFLSDWQKDFAYPAQIGWWIYVVAAFVALLIACITVSFQAVKAAMMNPVKALRTE